jgi:hypothetical protein
MYLSELGLQGYFDKPEFLNYLRYLEYWRGAGYIQFIRYASSSFSSFLLSSPILLHSIPTCCRWYYRYPTCLAYLTLLHSEMFRERLRDPIFVKEIYRIGQRHHETWYVLFFLPQNMIRRGDWWIGVWKNIWKSRVSLWGIKIEIEKR